MCLIPPSLVEEVWGCHTELTLLRGLQCHSREATSAQPWLYDPPGSQHPLQSQHLHEDPCGSVLCDHHRAARTLQKSLHGGEQPWVSAGEAGSRGSFSSHSGVLQDLLMERDVQSLETALECPVSISCHRCLHGEKLGNVSVQHQRGGSVLHLSILAPTLESEPEEEQVKWG